MRTIEVKSAARILDLLELLSVVPGPMRLTDIARQMNMPKSSTVALLGTLAGRGYVLTGRLTRCAAEIRRFASTRVSMSNPRRVGTSAMLPTMDRKDGSEICWREIRAYGSSTATVRLAFCRWLVAPRLIE